jgi:hypothetical protein
MHYLQEGFWDAGQAGVEWGRAPGKRGAAEELERRLPETDLPF